MNTEPFWKFINEREWIRKRRLNGQSMVTWSGDPIMKLYSFTNVKRQHDRTTTLLYQEFYGPRDAKHPSPIALLNSAIFRYFGKIETARLFGWHDTWNGDRKNTMVAKAGLEMLLGTKIFTSAYIVPNCGDTRPKHEVVADIIDEIWKNVNHALNTESWKEATRRLKMNWGVGSFMAKEVLLDYILATGWMPTDWTTWTPVGPGARRGAGTIVNGVIKGIPEYEALLVCRLIYDERDDRWDHPDIDLDLTDIQFQLCEFAKYEKARTGVGRPKKRFHPTIDEVTCPPIDVEFDHESD